MPPIKTAAAQRSFESLLKLLGGTAEDRLRFWEILKGITTPAQFKAATNQLTKLQSQLAGAQNLAKTLKTSAGKVAKG